MVTEDEQAPRLDAQKALSEHAAEGFTRWRWLERSDALPEHGVVFVLAIWSGPSLGAWRTLTTLLSGYEELELVVMSVDELWASDTIMKLFSPDIVGGWGESAWIKEGRVVAKLLRFSEGSEDAIRRNTESILPTPHV